MQHVVCVRFNVPFSNTTFSNLDPYWLDERLKITEAVFVPSMAQTQPPDKWLFAVSPGTPAFILDRLHGHGIETVECADSLTRAFASRLPREVVTTAFGSDDVMAPDFCERVRRWGEAAHHGDVLNFRSGYKVVGGQVYPMDWPAVGFQSLRSDSGGCVTGLGNHARIHEKFPVDLTDTAPAWGHVVHECNDSLRFGSVTSRVLDTDSPLVYYPGWLLPAVEYTR